MSKQMQEPTSLGVCSAATVSVWPLSAALVRMSWRPGEGCALHFNIPSLTGDVCEGFSLFLFSDFLSQFLL